MARTYSRKIPDNMNPWECSVNGKKYVYPSGTVQEVNEEVAEIIDQTAGFPAAAPEEKPPFEAQGGGSGGSGAVAIAINVAIKNETTIDIETTTCSTTYEEIYSALTETRPVTVSFYNSGVLDFDTFWVETLSIVETEYQGTAIKFSIMFDGTANDLYLFNDNCFHEVIEAS